MNRLYLSLLCQFGKKLNQKRVCTCFLPFSVLNETTLSFLEVCTFTKHWSQNHLVSVLHSSSQQQNRNFDCHAVCYWLKGKNKDEISVVLICASELEHCTGRKPNGHNLKLFIRQKSTLLYCMALRHTYQTKGLPQRTHNSFALDSRALLYFIASFVSIYCFVWRPFFHCIVNNLALLNTSIGLFCRLLGRYVKPVWSSYPHCSFGMTAVRTA